MREMRRNKQLLSEEETIAVLERGTAAVVAVMGDDGYPYAVPVSHVYSDGKIYFHSAKEGYKVDCFAANPKVCLTVIDHNQIVPEEYTTYFRSAMVFGRIRISEGEERRSGFLALCEKYSGQMPLEAREKKVDSCSAAYVYVIDIDKMTGKQAIELM